jgi:hypothetical protein
MSGIGEALLMAVGIALSPLPIAAVILMLLTARAGSNALAFLFGWIVGIVAVSLVVFVLPGVETESGEPTSMSGYVRLTFGVALLVLAARQWRTRPAPGAETNIPRLSSGLDSAGMTKAAGLGFGLSAMNPKNLPLIVAGAATIDASGLNRPAEAIALALFAGIAGSSVMIPVGAYFIFRRRIEPVFLQWKGWLIRNNALVLTALFGVFGTLLLFEGAVILAG